MNVTRFSASLTVWLAVSAAHPAFVWAQSTCNLPAEIVGSSDLSQADKDRIKACVDANKEGLRGTPAEIKKSRNAMLEPLRGDQVSVQFRLEYTRQLVATLKPLSSDQDEIIAVNALRITGELATAGSVDILAEALKDKRPGVRHAAATGFKRTFVAIERTAPAIGTGQQALRTLDALKAALEAEGDPHVLEEIVLAFQQATKIPSQQLGGMRDAAMDALALATSAKLAKGGVSPDAERALRRGAQTIREAVSDNIGANQPRIDDGVLRRAAAMAGDLLAYVYNRLKDGALDGGAAPNNPGTTDRRRSDLALLASESERAVFFIHEKLGGQPTDFELGKMIQQNKEAQFQKDVMQLIGANGLLTDTMFGNQDKRFIK